jgi:hypothetical protein
MEAPSAAKAEALQRSKADATTPSRFRIFIVVIVVVLE